MPPRRPAFRTACSAARLEINSRTSSLTWPGQTERETTLKVVCGMNETSFNLHFTHASFNEGLANLRGPTWSPAIAELPKVVGSGVQVRQSVAGTANAVGFIKASQLVVQSGSSQLTGAALENLLQAEIEVEDTAIIGCAWCARSSPKSRTSRFLHCVCERRGLCIRLQSAVELPGALNPLRTVVLY